MPRMPRSRTDELPLSHRLQWHAGQSLQRGLGCSVVVVQPLGDRDHRRVAPAQSAPPDSDVTSSPLSQVASRLRSRLRSGDIVEVDDSTGIGILLFGADENGVRAVYQRISRDLSEQGTTRSARAGLDREQLHLGVGHASATPTDAGRLPALVRELVCVASVPDLWLTVPLPNADERAPSRKRGRFPTGGVNISAVSASGRGTGRPDISVLPPELAAHASSEEGEELRRRADAQGVPFVCLPRHLSPALRRVVSPELANELCAVPIGRTRGVLTVAMHDPSDIGAMQRLAAATGLTIFPVLASRGDLTRMLDQIAAEAGSEGRGARALDV
jgi:Type II secretion system (T2SS), protein E, N-terminal domain